MSDRPAVRARAMILSTPWAMTPEMVQTMLAIADRENLSPEAVAAQLGRPLDNTRGVSVRDGVAVIPVDGPISRRMDLFTEISGGTTIETLATDLRAALDSPNVHSIVLAIDSPGGEVSGVAEFAAMVRATNAEKPVTAYVGGLGASAAYWIAAAAGEVVADSTALVGSIGVVLAVPNPDKSGNRSIEFVSSQSPHKRPDPRTEGGRNRLQALVDDLAALFIDAVASYRDLSAEAIAATGGGLLVGQQAVDAGLADRLGSFEGVIAQLQERAREPRRIGGGRIAASQEDVMAQEQPKQPGFWSKFWGNLGAQMDADESFTPAAIASQGPSPAPAPAIPAQPDPETVALRAELARLKGSKRDAIPADAAAFADAEIRAGRALPAEHDALVGMYTDAATDDLDFPRAEGQPSRVARLNEHQAARPKHNMTTELVPVRKHGDGTLTALENQQETRAEGDEPVWTPERWRDQRAHTPIGRTILAGMGVPESGPLTQAQREAIAARANERLAPTA